jgi:hypothetical protein
MFPEKLELKIEEHPKKEDYKSGGPAWIVGYSHFMIRPEPLSSFKRDSKFRLFAIDILKKYNLDPNSYTLIYNTEPEWLSYFTLSKIN